MDTRYNLSQQPTKSKKTADRSLQIITKIIFSIAVLGQWLFVFYIVVFYGGVALSGDIEKINDTVYHGIISGDTMGNAAFAIHVFLAAIITFGGPIQFMKPIRTNFPTFHRWNGRIYFVTAILISLAGLYMIFSRGPAGSIAIGIGNTINATLIITFAFVAWRYAMKRKFDLHKKWAIRTFIVVSGVWFFRIGYGLWILITGFTAPGVTNNLDGPFDIFLGFAHTILPLMILELYFYVIASKSTIFKRWMSAFLILLTILLSGGIVMAFMIFWAPQL